MHIEICEQCGSNDVKYNFSIIVLLYGLSPNNPIPCSTCIFVLLIQWVSTHNTVGNAGLTLIKIVNSHDLLMMCIVD